MPTDYKDELVRQVIIDVREYGITNVLFRNIIANRLGVNITDIECLGLLFHKGISTPSQLSEYTGLSSGATTAMLDRLEKSGIIERRPNPEDRRGTLIVIVKEQADKLAPMFESGREAQIQLVSKYNENELQLISSFLRKFVIVMEQERNKLNKKLNDELKS
jgi:DNA-binding MarR family transcriptional regulator